jgi:hypothetical protein
MSPALLAGALWAIAAAVTALLPMRLQYPPGITLLVLAPVLILWIGWVHGWVLGALGLAAFVSMFRNPLRYLWKKARGLPVSRPEEHDG